MAIYFFVMFILDVRFILNNEENFESSMPASGENIIYTVCMAIPLLILLIIKLIIKIVLKKNGIELKGIINKKKIIEKLRKWYPLFVILILVLPIILILIIQNRFLYYPSYDDMSYKYLKNKKSSRLEEIEISSDKGIYHGWGYMNSQESSTIIYFGGNAQSSENFFSNMEERQNWGYFENYNVIMIDYPGYGLSDGNPGYDYILKMADDTYQYIREDEFYGNNKIIIMGFSLGTGVATYVAASNDIDGLILIAPYDNGVNLYNNVCNIFHGPLELLVRNPFPSDQFAENVTAPTLVIASKRDEVIPYDFSLQLTKSFSDKKFVGVNGLYHNDLLDNERVLEYIQSYLNE